MKTPFNIFKNAREGVRYDSVRDWLMLLIFSAILFIGIVVWNMWVFDTVVSGGSLGAPIANPSQVFNSSSLDTIHSIFIKRNADYC